MVRGRWEPFFITPHHNTTTITTIQSLFGIFHRLSSSVFSVDLPSSISDTTCIDPQDTSNQTLSIKPIGGYRPSHLLPRPVLPVSRTLPDIFDLPSNVCKTSSKTSVIGIMGRDGYNAPVLAAMGRDGYNAPVLSAMGRDGYNGPVVAAMGGDGRDGYNGPLRLMAFSSRLASSMGRDGYN